MKKSHFCYEFGVFLRKGEAGSLWVLWGLVSSLGCGVLSRTAPVGLWGDLQGFPTFQSTLSLRMGCGFAFFPLQFSPIIHYRLIIIILSPGQAWRYFKPWWEVWREESQTHPQADKILSHELFFFSR